MSFLPFFALFPASLLGYHSVRWRDRGCAAWLSLCGGGLLSAGLSGLTPGCTTWTPVFLPVFLCALLQADRPQRAQFWRQEWGERTGQLFPWTLVLSVLCGLTGQWLPAALLAGAYSSCRRLSGAASCAVLGHTALLFVLALLSTVLSGGGLTAQPLLLTLVAAVSLCTALLQLVPLSEQLSSPLQSRALLCLFVFLIYQYTNSIIFI